jgi:hypothetical protein
MDLFQILHMIVVVVVMDIMEEELVVVMVKLHLAVQDILI